MSTLQMIDPVTYSKLDYTQDAEYNQQQVEIYKQSMRKWHQENEAPMDPARWEEPQLKQLLSQVFLEIENDSETEFGSQIYKQQNDPEYHKLLKQRDEYLSKFKEESKKIQEGNKRNKQLGLPLQKVPDIRHDTELMLIEGKIEVLPEKFRINREDRMNQAFGRASDKDENYQPKNLLINQLNTAISNQSLTFDKRVEMAILALRERRRFNQLRRLGIKVPISYPRAYRITVLPKKIQEEIIKYNSCIEDDSEYEDDATVHQKYSDNPVQYLQQNSQQNREKLEGGAEPRRIQAAREKAGSYKFHNIFEEITYAANNELLTNNNIRKGNTKEKQDGTYRRPEHVTQEFLQREEPLYLVEFIKKYYDQYPRMFELYPTTKDQILNKLKGNRIQLRKYPDVVRAMFQGQEIPEDLRVEENQHESIVIKQMDEHLSRRESAALPQKSASSDSYEPSAFMSDQEVEELKSLKKSKQKLSEQSKPQVKLDHLFPSMAPTVTREVPAWLQVKKGDSVKLNQLSKFFQDISSDSSGNTRALIQQRNQELVQVEKQKFEHKLLVEKTKRESQYWHQFYDYIIKRSNDLGLPTLHKYVNKTQQRTLTRREQTAYLKWKDLGESAEESDNSLKRADFTHPLLKAKQQMRLQKHIPEKKAFTERKLHHQISINGTTIQWGEFLKKFKDEMQQKLDNNEEISQQELILNLNDPQKEKLLYWNTQVGFTSENSDDEQVKYRRTERQYFRRLHQQHKGPFLRERPIKPFERLMLRFGGAEILRRLTDKSFLTDGLETIYEWVDPSKPLHFNFGDFLLAQEKAQSESIYQKERAMQELVMDKEKVATSLFVNELVQVYELFTRVVKDKELIFPRELKQCLPKSKREYLENINFQEFKSPVKQLSVQQSPVKSKQGGISQKDSYKGSPGVRLSEQMNKLSLENEEVKNVHWDDNENNQYENAQEEVYDDPDNAQDDYDEEVVEIDTTQPRQEANRSKVLFNPQPQVINIERPKFNIPKSHGPDFEILQKRLYDFQETVIVDDYIEIKNMLRELEAIDPQKVQSELIPRLQKLISESNGKLKSYYIWPHHLPGGEDLIYPNGRRYPKRLRQYKHQPENKVIHIHGVEVGYVIPTVPFLHPDVWKGQAISLQQQTGIRRSIGSQQQRPPAPAQQKPPTAAQQRNKKRRFNEANKMGVGIDDIDKDQDALLIEKVLPFMSNKDNQRDYELVDVKREGNKFTLELAINPKKSLKMVVANSKKLLVTNTYNKVKTLKLNYRSTINQQSGDIYIDKDFTIPNGSIWNMTNEGNTSINIHISFNK